MRIRPIQINTCLSMQSKNFTGKIILSENISVSTQKFIDNSIKKLSKIIEEKPYDVYVKEVVKKEKETPDLVFIVKDKNKSSLSKREAAEALSVLIEESRTVEKNNLELKMPPVSIKELAEQIKFLKNKPKREYYVPKTIGKPQKPYIKKR